ncbi:MAG: DUF6371 domain-containing protein [Fulvivirga sp.]
MEELHFDKKRLRVKYCPCGKSNRDGKFVPYEGFEEKGYCHSCCRTFLPEIKIDPVEQSEKFVSPPPKPVSYFDPAVMGASLKGYDQNNFVLFLESKFGKAYTMKAVEAYKVGTSKRWPGANIFWQIDPEGKIRSGKIMLYDSSKGKRQNKNSWVHSVLKLEDFQLNQCFFGSHLLMSDPVKNVAIVESEKTAIIASILKPEFIWMATGGKGGLRPDRCLILESRNVFLFPDLTKPGDKVNCYELWTEKAKELSKETPRARFYVSDYLETNATVEERNLGLDIADYFLKWEWENERNEQNEAFQKPFISAQIQNDGEDAQIRSIETEICLLSKQIRKVVQDLRREKA